MEMVMEIGGGVLMVLGGLVVILHAVAPLTKTEVDNKVLSVLQKVIGFLSAFVTPKVAK